jgi:hypothetical protein
MRGRRRTALQPRLLPGRIPGLLAGLLALVLVAACDSTDARQAQPSGGTQTPSVSPSTTTQPASRRTTPSGSASAPSTASSSAAPVADPEHAVDPPGPRTGQLGLADLIVYNTHTLSPDLVSRIKHLKGVTGVESMAMGQVVIENKSLTVAAVDPGTYRDYTPYASAETQQVWDRVAGGEVALRPGLQKHVPLDDQDYLKLGSGRDAPRVHVGAWAPQTPEVDAVVNDTWVKDLGMEPGNALLITTGQTSPESLRKPIEKIAGSGASVQLTDVVAREGLDTSVQQTAFLVGTVADAVGTFNYTVLGGGHIAPDPAWVRSHIATEPVPILGNVTCNRLMFPQLRAALQEVVDRGLASKIHPGEYAGCYYPRFIAGTTSLSNHSFGLALDLNVPGNQRGTPGEMDRTVVSIFEKWGFTWGGTWHYTDPMHFEMNRLVNPR